MSWYNDHMSDKYQDFIQPRTLLKEMHAHRGVCTKQGCKGIVKMARNMRTFELDPNDCFCYKCGSKYYMLIDDIEKWELEQWEQKEKENESNTVVINLELPKK